ncbi:unnamed protein product [Allacma fusca]|uniref:G-protein coupled receptors family 1 profile domain-containing protein n=1 Tax=Allacma fusca TaxID=39272 RepID=A0A8J2J6E5_9HEXA|nr:unnamed protein product [Allacma fusca]
MQSLLVLEEKVFEGTIVGTELSSSVNLTLESGFRMYCSTVYGISMRVDHIWIELVEIAVVVAFFVCWAPFHAQRLIWKWGSGAGTTSPALQTLYHIATYLSGVLYYLATCVNPVLYHTMSLKFRHAFKETVNGCCGTESSRRRRGYRSTQSTSGSSRSQGLILTDITTTLTVTSSLNSNNGKNGHYHPCHHPHTHHPHTHHSHIYGNGKIVAL